MTILVANRNIEKEPFSIATLATLDFAFGAITYHAKPNG